MVDRSRLTRGDGAALAAWFAAGLGGLLVFVALYGKAFPEASVEITVGREAALAASRSYLESLGYDLGSYRSAIACRAEREAKTYLEKELGLAAADRLMREAVSVWYWRCRWFKAEEEEEFFVELGPGGRLRGFTHRIPEQEAGERLSAEEARGQAEACLRGLPHVAFDGYRCSACP